MLLSSKMSLALKIYLPLLWFIFFGMWLIAGLLGATGTFLDQFDYQLGFLFLYLSFGVLYYFTFFQLKRIEFIDGELYVSNYRKTYKYSLESISRIEEQEYGLFTTVRITLAQAGSFGRDLVFIPIKPNYLSFLKNNLDRLSHLA